MTQAAKKRFLGFLLGELAKTVPIEQARVATLAGVGLEAELWAEHGILPDNGWLVDSDPKAIRKLINKESGLPWRLYRGQAHSFPAVLKATYGEEACLDLFHLDLYGTVEKALFEAGSLIPIVAKSQARMFALTVSDQRGHQATMFSGSLWSLMNELFADLATVILRGIDYAHFSVIAAQRAISDPYSSVRREIATVLSMFCAQFGSQEDFQQPAKDIYPILKRLAHKAAKEQLLVYPVAKMYRLSYADGYRMKSYIFIYGSERVPYEDALLSLGRAWIESPFHYFDKAGNIQYFGMGNADVSGDSPFAKLFPVVLAAGRLEKLLPVLEPAMRDDLQAVISYFQTR